MNDESVSTKTTGDESLLLLAKRTGKSDDDHLIGSVESPRRAASRVRSRKSTLGRDVLGARRGRGACRQRVADPRLLVMACS